MANNIDILISAQDTATKVVDGLYTELGKLDKMVSGLDKNIVINNKNMGSMNDMLRGMGVEVPKINMYSLGQGIKLVGDEIGKSLDSYMLYVGQVKELATYTGMSVEETSRLLQLSDDLGIKNTDLEASFKTMVNNGVRPNVIELGLLSEEYNKLKDPLEKAKFLTDNFGKSAGVEMARMMDLGKEGIYRMYGAVESGLVVTQTGIDKAGEYKIAMNKWEESVEGVRYKIASGLIPILITAMGYIDGAMTTLGQLVYLVNNAPSTLSPMGLLQGALGTTPTAPIPSLYTTPTAYIPSSAPSYNYNRPGAERHASGADFTVPSNYTNDTYPLGFATAGEHVSITPAGRSSGAVNVFLTYNPVVSLMDRAEAETKLIPYIQAALRKA
jgi:hypothetical protein